MARHEESLDGGLVTIRDPALLSPGQLSGGQNFTYMPGTNALHRSAGRAVFGTVSATAVDVVGLRDMTFDNGTQVVIAHASASYITATAGTVSTFGVLTAGIGIGSQLEAIQYRNRYFLLNGTTSAASAIGSNKVAYLTATGSVVPTTRQHGMLPVEGALVSASSATAFSQSVTGYYEYWATEVAKLTADSVEFQMESTFIGNPTTVYVTSTGMSPSLGFPAVRNAITTHWRIYRSPKKDAEKDKKFPSGFMIAEVATAATAVMDTSITASASAFGGSVNSGGESYATFTNASNLLADDGSNATITPAAFSSINGQGVYGFNLGGFSGVIKGIAVEVQGHVSSGSAPCPIWVRIGKNRQSTGDFVPAEVLGISFDLARNALIKNIYETNTAWKSALITATSAQTVTLGSATDRWFPQDKIGLVDSDFSTSLMVVLGVGPGVTGKTLSFDYVKVIVYYGATFDSVIQFPTVVYTFGDISAQVGKNGMPPSASTGDMYEDCLVCNDVSNPALIRWSYPGDPESFPGTYYIDFETRDNDRVTLVKSVGERLVVGLQNSIWRVNYLPSERDASFDRGKAKQRISGKHGVVNPMCACLFTRDGGNEELAWISAKGLHTTDAFNFQTRSGQLEWRNIISLTSTSSPICLIDDPENERLMFFYRNDGNGNETYLRLDFSYAKGDVDQDGNFKASGPTHMRNFDSGTSQRADLKSAWSVPMTSGGTNVYFGYGGAGTAAGAGKVYLETGTTIPAEDSTLRYTTRRMYLAGFSSEWRMNELYGYCSNYTATATASYTPLTRKTNDTAEVTQGSKSVNLTGTSLHRAQFNLMSEGMRIAAIVTATNFQQELLIIDGENFGVENSGR